MSDCEKKGIVMNSAAPFENAMEPLDKGYYILGGIGLIVGGVRAGLSGAALLALLGLILWWGIKANIALAKWRKLRTCQFHLDSQLSKEELFGRLVPALTPYGLRVDSSEGMPLVAFRNIQVEVVYNENGTFSLPWSQNLGFFLFDRRYITSYLNTVAVMSIIAYHVQKVSSADSVDSKMSGQNNPAVQPMQFAPPRYVKKGTLQAVLIGLLILITAVGVIRGGGDKRYIDSVKYGSPSAYPQITYGEAFKDFFKHPKWKYFKSKGGDDVVEFSGRCTYQGKEVGVDFQFVLSKDDDTFEITYMGLNDISQNQFVIAAIVEKAFEEYGDSHGKDKAR